MIKYPFLISWFCAINTAVLVMGVSQAIGRISGWNLRTGIGEDVVTIFAMLMALTVWEWLAPIRKDQTP